MSVKEIADYSSETGKQNAESSLVTVVIFINIGIVFVNKRRLCAEDRSI